MSSDKNSAGITARLERALVATLACGVLLSLSGGLMWIGFNLWWPMLLVAMPLSACLIFNWLWKVLFDFRPTDCPRDRRDMTRRSGLFLTRAIASEIAMWCLWARVVYTRTDWLDGAGWDKIVCAVVLVGLLGAVAQYADWRRQIGRLERQAGE